jgi:uncharacterized protein YllA (UPF0747 family)
MTMNDNQLLLSMVKREITMLTDFVQHLKRENRQYYEDAEEGTSKGREAFINLNVTRNSIRAYKARIKRLATVAKNLKQEIKGV